jgi:hypothetical protein
MSKLEEKAFSVPIPFARRKKSEMYDNVILLSDAQAEIDKQQDSCVETVILHKKKIKSLEQENKELIKRLQESQGQEMILGMAYDKYKKENKVLIIERDCLVMDCAKLISEKWDIPLKDLINIVEHLNNKP